eukprot:5762508-Pyramimonas_sp.AAC.1
MLYKCCTYPVPILYLSCTNAVQMLYKCCTNAVPILYKCCTFPVPKFCTNALYHPDFWFGRSAGAVMGLATLGPRVSKLLLLPNLPTYLAWLQVRKRTLLITFDHFGTLWNTLETIAAAPPLAPPCGETLTASEREISNVLRQTC